MTPLRCLLTVVAIAGVFVLSSSPQPRSVADSELATMWTDPADLELSRRLDSRAAAVLVRIEQKTRIVDDVRAGRVTRDAAAAKFREMLDADPVLLEEYRARSPGLTDDELAHDNLIRHLSTTDRPE